MTLSLQAKLASIVVHVQEGTGGGGHRFDLLAMKQLANDPEVTAWVASLGPLVPLKR